MKLEKFEFNPVEDKELGVTDYMLDAFAAPVRGLEGLAHGVYNLGDFLAFDVLPDWDEQRFFGRSQTLPGQLIEGITQFGIPFGAITKGISLAGKATKAGKVATALTKGKKTGKITDLNAKGFFTAAMASDFVAFDGQEERLSNMIQQFPELQNPVTQFLQANPDDNELVGRLKNVIEGVLLEAGMLGVSKSFMAGLSAVKTRSAELAKGATKQDATVTAALKYQDEVKEYDPNMFAGIEDRENTAIADFWTDLSAKDDEVFRFLADDFETAGIRRQFKDDPKEYLRRMTSRFLEEDIEVIGGQNLKGATYQLKYGPEKSLKTTVNIEKELQEFVSNSNQSLAEGFIEGKPIINVGATDTGKGKGTGSPVYKAILQYAHDSGSVYEPTSLTPINKGRTLGAMLSSALQNHTTKHMVPGRDHLRYLQLPKRYQWGLNWKNDIQYLAKAEARYVEEKLNQGRGVGTFDRFRYSLDEDKFYIKNAENKDVEVNGDIITKYIQTFDPNFDDGIGKATVKRAVVTNELLKSEGLETLGQLSGGLGNGKAAKRHSLSRVLASVEEGSPDLGFGAVDANTKDLIEKGDANVGSVLRSLQENAGSDEVKNLAKQVDDILGDEADKAVPVKFHQGQIEIQGKPTDQFQGVYRSNEDEILLKTSNNFAYQAAKSQFEKGLIDEATFKAAGGPSTMKGNEHTIVHEILHAGTAKKIQPYVTREVDGREAYRDLQEIIDDEAVPQEIRNVVDIYKQTLDKIDNKDLYALSNLDEFMVGVLTDGNLQKWLKSQKYEGKKTFFNKVIEAVYSLFKGTPEGSSLLEKAIDDVAGVLQMKRPEGKTVRNDFINHASIRDVTPDEDVVNKLLNKIDVSKFTVGGRQALTGLARSISELPDGMFVEDLSVLMDTLTKKLSEGDPKQLGTMTQEVLDEGVVNEFADALGTDGRYLNGLLNEAAKDRTTLRRVAARMKALEAVLVENGTEIIRTAERYRDMGKKLSVEETESLEARLRTLLDQQLHIQANASGLASGFGQGLKSRQMGVRIGLSKKEIANEKLRQEYLNKRGSMTIDDIVENVLLAKERGNGDLWNTLINLNKINRGTQGGKLTNMIEEYYKNSLMWGPRSLTINALGTGLSTMMKQFERTIGGFFSGAPKAQRAAIDSWSRSSENTDLLRFVLKAWKSGDHYIGSPRSAFAEQSAESIGAISARNVEDVLGRQIENDSVKGFIDFMGNLVRVPNRFNTSVDQMYKFYEYRSRSKTQLAYKAINELGITDPEEIGTYVTDSFNALVTRSNRNFSEANLIKEANEFVQGPFKTPADREKAIYDYVEQARSEKLEIARTQGLVGEDLNDYSAMDELTRNWIDPSIKTAEEVTFSGDLGVAGQAIQRAVGALPGGFIVAPFIRTPTNILKFAFSRIMNPAQIAFEQGRMLVDKKYKQRVTDLIEKGLPANENVRLSFIEELNAVKPDRTPDYLRRAEARGKMATGVFMNTALLTTVFAFKDRINGGGPKDFKQRQAWQAAGNMPYSIKVGDKWISYQRLDPIASMVGVYADMADLLDDNKLDSIGTSDASRVFSAFGLTLARNATNKSYLAGIDKFMDVVFEPEGTTAAEYAGSVVAGFIPNIFNQGQSIAGDMELKEVRGFWDVLQKRIPGVSQALDLKRNIIGEPVVQEYFEGVAGIINPLNPIMWGGKENDEVLFELARVGHGFTAPSTKLDGLIELTNFQKSNGRSAHDRWMELHSKVKLNGLTLRQALAKLIKNKQYQALDDSSFSGLPSPRVRYLSRVINRYRSKAKQEMLNEFPEIKQLQREVKISKKAGRTEDVLELLAQ